LLGVTPLLGRQVLKQRLLEAHSPRIVHLAAPGYFLGSGSPSAEKTPGPRRDRLLQRSGLALAGANASVRGETLPDGAGDGLLMTQDAVHLDLAATDLVVLPISGGGVAEVGSGPGLTALQRAFRLAGAKAVLLALWEVPAPLRREVLAEF